MADEDDSLSNEELEALAELQCGMVRTSFGIHTTHADIDAVASALRNISDNREIYEDTYVEQDNGDYVHKTFTFDHTSSFSIRGEVDAWLAALRTRTLIIGMPGPFPAADWFQ